MAHFDNGQSQLSGHDNNLIWVFFKSKIKVFSTTIYDFEAINDRQKYDVGQLRQRVQDFMQKSGKGARGGKAVKTLANVGARASAFK